MPLLGKGGEQRNGRLAVGHLLLNSIEFALSCHQFIKHFNILSGLSCLVEARIDAIHDFDVVHVLYADHIRAQPDVVPILAMKCIQCEVIATLPDIIEPP